MTVYIVVDEYEQRDGCFGLDEIFLDIGKAEAEAKRLIEYNKEEFDEETNHDVYSYKVTE